MISIPRCLARDLRAVFRRISPGRAGPHPVVELLAGRDGLRVRGLTDEVAAEYRQPGPLTEARVAVPLDALADCAGRDDSPVTFRAATGGKVEVRWAQGGVPQYREYDGPANVLELPSPPDTFADNPPGLLTALDHAAQVAPKESARFALQRVLLSGVGEVVASDGRQLLVQGGFRFPWTGDVLVPRCAAFAAPELTVSGPVGVGRTEGHVWIKEGGWSFALRIDRAGRYPDVKSVIPAGGSATTRLRLDPKDGAGLAAVLPDLPGGKDEHRPVTLDLNGHVAVRVRASGQTQATELLLARSRVEGGPVRFATDRTYLARAAKLGFGEVQVSAADRPVVCRDATRTYVWMPLGAEGALPPSPDALRASLPAATEKERVRAGRKKARHAARKPASAPVPLPAGDLLGEAVAVQAALRELLGRVRCLTVLIRQEHRTRRAVSATLASLRQLEKIAP